MPRPGSKHFSIKLTNLKTQEVVIIAGFSNIIRNTIHHFSLNFRTLNADDPRNGIWCHLINTNQTMPMLLMTFSPNDPEFPVWLGKFIGDGNNVPLELNLRKHIYTAPFAMPEQMLIDNLRIAIGSHQYRTSEYKKPLQTRTIDCTLKNKIWEAQRSH